MKRISWPVLLACITMQLTAQNNFWQTADAYLGQTPPGNIPVKFAPALLAQSPYFSANKVAFSADGKEFFYCRNKSWKNANDLSIQCFTYRNGAWQGPVTINEHYNAPALSPDGQWLYFNDNNANAWRSRRTANGWGQPQPFFESHVLYDLVPTRSGTIYSGSIEYNGVEKTPRNFDVSRAHINGKDTTFISLGKPLNAPGWNGDFFISADESFIIISAKENKANSELYISYRKPNNTWTNPKSLGAAINNDVSHRYGEYVTPDRKYLFYCYGHSEADCAIYWVRFDNLYDSLKHTNFEPFVRDSLAGKTITAGKVFSIAIPANAFADDDGAGTLMYTAQPADGTALPAWLHFNSGSKTFSGTAPATGSYNITVTATDTAGAQAASTFMLTVAR